MKKESVALLNEFGKIVESAYLNSKNGEGMTKEEMEIHKARMADISKKYSVSYRSQGFFRSSRIILGDKK